MKHIKISRWGTSLLVTVLLFVSLTPVFANDQFPDPETANINWEQAAGSTIHLLMNIHYVTDALKPFIPEFEKLSGVKVELEEYPFGEQHKKACLELSSLRPAFDVLMFNRVYTTDYCSAGWLEPLRPYLNDPELTDIAWYDFGDYPSGSYAEVTHEGKLYGIPVCPDNQILFYRKDLFAEKGLDVPYTMDDMYDAAIQLKSDTVSGMLLRMKRAEAPAWPWHGFVFTYGGMWVDRNLRVFLNSPQTIEATKMYVKLVKDAGPKGVVTYGWYENEIAFGQGKAAMWTDAGTGVGEILNPAKSKVADKIGFGYLPASPSGHRQPAAENAWNLAVVANSPNKTASWLFIEWATSKKLAGEQAAISGVVMRDSVWDYEEFTKNYPYPEWSHIMRENMKRYSGRIWLPQIKGVFGALDIVAVALEKIYFGTPAEEAMEEAQAKTVALIEEVK